MECPPTLTMTLAVILIVLLLGIMKITISLNYLTLVPYREGTTTILSGNCSVIPIFLQ